MRSLLDLIVLMFCGALLWALADWARIGRETETHKSATTMAMMALLMMLSGIFWASLFFAVRGAL